ncbi:MAG: RsmB/NOP family class I SAM-dependent RNA methyltransferase [Alphaproteobacteria bacterium]|nr:RsmB/NOP family class I SAM-dependent RNA methyltransferase [Alphaproteobacteria bacterium]
MKEEVILLEASNLIAKIEREKRPASEIINSFTRTHKSFGSKDRKKLTDLVWIYIRHKMRLDYLYPTLPISKRIEILNANTLQKNERMPFHIQMEVPDWIVQKIKNPEKELPALLDSPQIILRANGNRAAIRQALLKEGVETEETTLSPFGLVLKNRVNLNMLQSFKNGLIEVQDEGSQLVALATKIKKGETVLDYCAGAGGKSLIFAQMMEGKGKIISHDISRQSLEELKKRALRAQIQMIETTTDLPKYLKKNPQLKFSHVVVDAPCSGTGTWRRCPDARWKLTEEEFSSLLKKQQMILKKASTYVEKGAYLSYMTCSLTQDENISQVQKFLKTHPTFKLKTHKQFSPYQTKTDGLFVAVMQREM